MSKKILKTIISSIAFVLVMSYILSGCAGNGTTVQTNSKEIKYVGGGEIYPMKSEDTLSVWD